MQAGRPTSPVSRWRWSGCSLASSIDSSWISVIRVYTRLLQQSPTRVCVNIGLPSSSRTSSFHPSTLWNLCNLGQFYRSIYPSIYRSARSSTRVRANSAVSLNISVTQRLGCVRIIEIFFSRVVYFEEAARPLRFSIGLFLRANTMRDKRNQTVLFVDGIILRNVAS